MASALQFLGLVLGAVGVVVAWGLAGGLVVAGGAALCAGLALER